VVLGGLGSLVLDLFVGLVFSKLDSQNKIKIYTSHILKSPSALIKVTN
jgi:hypothetical protein